MGDLHLYIYDQIGGSLFEGGITAKDIREKLSKNRKAENIILHINSPGGSVYEGYTIFNILKSSGKKITARVEGICASIATLIALSADRVEMLPLAQWLVHNPFVGMEGDADELRKAAEELEKIQSQLLAVYTTRTGKSKDEIQALMNEDKMLTADEALEMGFIDEIVEPMKAVAYWKNKNEEKMDNKIVDAVNKLGDKIEKLFKRKNEGEPVSVSTTLEDGTEVVIEPAVENGATMMIGGTQATEGSYTLADGTKITVDASGVITNVEAPATDNSEALKKENEDLKAKVAQLEAEKAAQATDLENQNKAIDEVKKEIQALKKLTIGVKDDLKKPVQNFKDKDKIERASVWDTLSEKIKK